MRTFHFSTVVSIGYIYKFLAMQESLAQYCNNYHLFALCADPMVYKALKKLPLKNITLLLLSNLEKEELLIAKSNRNHHEYCWTLKPFMLNYVMKKYKDTQYYAHLDADLFFYSAPDQIINEDPNASLFLTDHNNSERFIHTYVTSGIYNTGFVGCKNDLTANQAVEWWLDRCLEKCSLIANVEKGLYGDQKYVEKWPQLFNNVHIVDSKGANVAQWNVEGFHINEREGIVYVNHDPLIFYHFSGLSILNKKEFNLSTFYRIEEAPLKMIYMPYIKQLAKHIELMNKKFPEFKDGLNDVRFIPGIHIEKL